MARRSEHSQEQIKEMVLNAAETIVIEDGFEALKVRQIAMEIGYTVGSIYMVFENMGDLITHLKARTLDDMGIELEKVQNSNDDAQTQLMTLSNAYVNFASQNLNRWLMVSAYHSSEKMPLPDWYQQKNSEILKRIESLLKQLAPQSNTLQQAAQALWGGIQGICLSFLTAGENKHLSNDIESTVLLLTENFIKGWLLSINH